MQHILSAGQFTTKQIEVIFKRADEMKDAFHNDRAKLAETHRGRLVATLFYEPSTRTRLSFEAAAQCQGMGVLSTENAGEFSSAVKGETIEDTIKVVSRYADIVVIRHKENGTAERAAAVSKVPIMNAGDGTGEHPTQSLLDLYTIFEAKGRLDNLHVVIGGDLKHGRTVRSLARMLSLYPGNSITFVSTPELQADEALQTELTKAGVAFTMTDDMLGAVSTADVVYWTRLQKERLTDPSLESSYVIDEDALNAMPKDAIIMHPLPRVGEIAESVDADPRARYFEQAGNGLYVRAALLDLALQDTAKG